jgi:hypothetical protein
MCCDGEKIVAKLSVFFVLVLYRRLVSLSLPFFLPSFHDER